MNKIPQRNDWIGELRVIALFAVMILIIGALLWIGAVTGGLAL